MSSDTCPTFRIKLEAGHYLDIFEPTDGSKNFEFFIVDREGKPEARFTVEVRDVVAIGRLAEDTEFPTLRNQLSQANAMLDRAVEMMANLCPTFPDGGIKEPCNDGDNCPHRSGRFGTVKECRAAIRKAVEAAIRKAVEEGAESDGEREYPG